MATEVMADLAIFSSWFTVAVDTIDSIDTTDNVDDDSGSTLLSRADNFWQLPPMIVIDRSGSRNRSI